MMSLYKEHKLIKGNDTFVSVGGSGTEYDAPYKCQ